MRYIVILCVVFFSAIILDLTPYLRGPQDPFLESRWPYYFVNTYQKIWAPLLALIPFTLLFAYVEKKNFGKNKELFLLIILSLIVFLFQLSLIYFSRFGITILFRRLIDPGINGYFSTALKIDNIFNYFSSYSEIIYTFDQHARGHPPGAVLTIKLLLEVFENFTRFAQLDFSSLNSLKVGWANHLWTPLSLSQKTASLFIPFLLHLFSALTIIPFFYLTKAIFKNKKVAFRSTFIYATIPSLSFFALTFDPIYAAFPILCLLTLIKGFEKNNKSLIFLSGLIFGIGLFFSLSILPVLLGTFVFSLIFFKKNIDKVLKKIFIFTSGMLFVFIFLFALGFNFFKAYIAVIQNQAPRDYFLWTIYNPYDFFIFMGLATSCLFFIATWNIYRKKHIVNKIEEKILVSFWVTFTILVVSGISRGEVGRIWITFMFIPVIFVGLYTTKFLKLTSTRFYIFLILAIIQIIIFEEYWVPIW